MNMNFSHATKRGGYLLHILLACGLCLMLAACGGETTTSSGNGKSGDVGDSGTKKRVAYGISVSVPDGWVVANSVEPGTISNADLNARIKGNPPVPVLALVLPSATPKELEARVIIYLADNEKYLLPEQIAANAPQEYFDKQAQLFMQQRNEAAKKAKQKSVTQQWSITRENVNGKLAVMQQGIGVGDEGRVSIQIWYIYISPGVALAIESYGNADLSDMGATMESIARSISIADTE